MDVLSDVLAAVRLSGAVLFRADFSAPWAVSAPDSGKLAPLLLPGAERLVLFHVIEEGVCWVKGPGAANLELTTGDVLVIPGGGEHVMGQGANCPLAQITGLLSELSSKASLPVLTYGGGGTPTRVVCGFLHCEGLFNPLLGALPPMFAVRAGGHPSASWLQATVRRAVEESRSPSAGSASVMARLSELLFVEAIRQHMKTLPEEERTWLSGLRDPHVGRALQAMHVAPDRDWTVEALAREAGVSRTVLAERFGEFVGMPPIKYLASWRIQVASRLLRETSEGIGSIATRVGYESEAAFHRSFKRLVGKSPAAWRSQERRGAEASGKSRRSSEKRVKKKRG